jgi:hypothetical protein
VDLELCGALPNTPIICSSLSYLQILCSPFIVNKIT